MYSSKKTIQAVLAMFTVLAFASCKKDFGEAPQISALSIVNAAVGSPEVNVFMGGGKVSNDLFTFGKDISYFNAYSGEREVSFFEGTTKKTSGKFILNDGKFYSLFLAGQWPDTELVLLKDSLVRPAAQKARIRFVNMSKDGGVLNLGLTNGSTLISEKAYKAASDYMEVEGNKAYTFVIRNNAALADTVSIPTVNIETGRNYTIWAKGMKAQSGNNALGLGVIRNY